MAYQADIIIIGAGVIGLAIASQVSRSGREVYVLERNESFGLETSSRNSGTIHTSMLNPRGSWNARLCDRGNHLLYEIGEKYKLQYRQTGKLLVAVDESQIPALEELFRRRDEGIEMQMLSRAGMKAMEPDVEGRAALYLHTAGIIEVHSLMKYFLGLAREQGAQVVYASTVTAIEKLAEGYRVTVKEPAEAFSLDSRIVINCAGLESDKIAALAGIDIAREGYRLYYFKGEYYSLTPVKGRRVNRRLIYPLNKKNGLVGIHTVLDIDGRVRLGPDCYPVDTISYAIGNSRQRLFYEAAVPLFPFVEYKDISPESSGIMPRLYGENEPFRDFIIRHEADRGLTGLINLVGIESPGLTASPAIAQYVSGIVDDILKN
jgi:L-2-hydroxyglutarate oxidase LhgO